MAYNSSSNGEEMNENELENLSNLFNTGLDNYNGILSSDKPTNSPEMQVWYIWYLNTLCIILKF